VLSDVFFKIFFLCTAKMNKIIIIVIIITIIMITRRV